MYKKKPKQPTDLTTREAVREIFGNETLIVAAKRLRATRRKKKTTKK
jgi:hypothetical protein